MKYDFRTVYDRRNGGSGRSEKWGRYESDVLAMWVADMDFSSPPQVTAALLRQAEHPFYCYERYPEEMFDAFVGWVRERYDWEIEREAVLPVPGVVFGLNLAARVLDPRRHGLAVHIPAYPPLLHLAGNYGAGMAGIPLRDERGRWRIDMEELEKSIAGRDLFVLCNPQNPTGRCYDEEELQAIIGLCARHDMYVLADEIWADLTYPESGYLPAAAAAPEHAGRIVSFMAPSKTFNMAGLCVSFAVVTDPDLRTRIVEASRGIVPMINSFGMEAALAAYTGGGEWLEELRAVLQENRDLVARFVDSEMPSVRFLPPEGTYLAWLDFRETALADDPAGALLKRGRVALNPGPSFGDQGRGFARLNFACPRPVLQEGLERIAGVVKAG